MLFRSYDTPVVTIPQAKNVTPYYGPVKRYEYWWTGKNTEVLRFELSYNQLYTTLLLGDAASRKDVTSPIPAMAGHKAAAPRQGRIGGQALESQNTYVNYLTDPGAYVSAKITIMGDPDWLVQTDSSSINAMYNKYYGTNGFSINCNNGQVFVEIDFKEAIDYDNNTGTMSINDKLMFFDYPDEYKSGPNKIQGMAFMVMSVTSNFRSGKFEQTLDLTATIWDKPKSAAADPKGRETTANGQSNTEIGRAHV